MKQEDIDVRLLELMQLGYRFTKPLATRTEYTIGPTSEKSIKAIILDVETTGLNILSDKVIELGMLSFELCIQTGNVYKIIDSLNMLEDPGFSIPPESVKVHGITDAMVAGQGINDTEVANFLNGAKLIIAHNAKFDRPFIETRLPIFQNYAWACSLSQINWNGEGISNAKQEFLAYKFGFHFEGHRAINDCRALLEILQQKLPDSGVLVMRRLLDSLVQVKKELNITPLGNTFEAKDKLKARGYRYNSERKVWSSFILLENLEVEVDWLRKEVYLGRPFQLEQENIPLKNRFSSRPGTIEILSY